MKDADSSASKVLSTPELVQMITSDSLRGDIVRLSQVSRQTFSILAPIIWRYVTGAEKLLGLISSASLRYELVEPNPRLNALLDSFGIMSSANPWAAMNEPPTVKSQAPKRTLREITLHQSPNSDQFCRFDTYAPFVETIEVYFDRSGSFILSGWPVLVSRASIRPLLPKLQTLYVKPPSPHARVSELANWISILGSITVLNVVMGDQDCNWPDEIWAMSDSEMVDTLGLLAERCPNVQKLTLCQRRPEDSLGSGRSPAASNHSPIHWHGYLIEFCALRHLALTNGWTSRSSLITLGHLHTLESLHLYLGGFCGFDKPHEIDRELPDIAFQALRQLSLRNIASVKASDLLDVRKLLGCIVELEVDYSLGSEFGIFKERGEWLTKSLLPSIINAPRLETLRAEERVGSPNDKPDEIYLLTEPAAMQAMSRAPLRHIEFQHIHLRDGKIGLDLGVIWANVTGLILPCQLGSLEELTYFAAIPHLQRLLLSLEFRSKFTPTTIPNQHAPLRSLESSSDADMAFDLGTMNHTARVLLELWPGLPRVDWPEPFGFMDQSPESQILALVFDRVLAIHIGAGLKGDRRVSKAQLKPALCGLPPRVVARFQRSGTMVDSTSEDDIGEDDMNESGESSEASE